MPGEHTCYQRSEFEHIKADILEIKSNVKEQNKDLTEKMLSMRDSHTETKIYIKQIQESQSAMSKKTEDNQALVMKALEDIRNEPIKNLKYYKMVGLGFIITYILDTVFGIVRAYAS